MDKVIERLIEKQHYVVNRIEEYPDFWRLYSADKSKIIIIYKRYYSGKMPPFFRWPRQKMKLDVSRICGFMISASLDGNVLFEVAEADYPLKVKEEIKEAREIHKSNEAFKAKKEKEIEKLLVPYLLSFPASWGIESEMFSLPFGLRAYLKSRLHLSPPTEDTLRCVNLMYHLCGVVNTWCSRHLRVDEILGMKISNLDLYIRSAMFNFYDEVEPLRKYANTSLEGRSLFVKYDEIKQLISSTLPPISEPKLLDYLIWLVQDIAVKYVMGGVDVDTFRGKTQGQCQDILRSQYEECELLYHTNIVFPQKFSTQEIGRFVENFYV